MIQINAMGDACPLPVIKTKKAFDAMAAGQLQVLVDNDIAVQNIQRFAASVGGVFAVEQKENQFVITIDKGDTADNRALPQMDTPIQCAPVSGGKTVVVLSADTMGQGDDKLGHILMKGFVFALTQLDVLPDTVLLYNSGAKLSVEGSPSLADLRTLHDNGVTIMTCGTCLNHFDLTDLLGVGDVTNMYSIVEEMRGASSILRP